MALRTSLPVQPHLYIGDSTGRPLDYGMVYFGQPNKDPEFYPIDIYYDKDLSLAAAQPVRTKGGFLNANGDMTEIYASDYTYSVKVLDEHGVLVFYEPSMERVNISQDSQISTKLPYPEAIVRMQGDRNQDSVSAQDFGAIGNGIVDDTNAFANLEKHYTERNIDLQGKTYKVGNTPTANTYANGFFNIAGIIHPSEFKEQELKFKKHCMNFYTGDSNIPSMPEIFGGAKNVFQGFCIVPTASGLRLYVTHSSNSDGSYTDYGNFLAGETYRIVEYEFKEDGSTVQPISFSKPLNKLGHASALSYRYENNELYLYSGAPNASTTDSSKGGKGFSRTKWRGAATSNDDTTVYTLFDQPNTVGGKFSDFAKAHITVSSNTLALAGDYGKSKRVLTYDLDEVLASTDPRTVNPKTSMLIPKNRGVFQGMSLVGDKVITYYGTEQDENCVYIHDLSGSLIKAIENIPLYSWVNSAANLAGEAGRVLDLYECEGVYVFANDVYIGTREYWQTLGGIVSYNGAYYACIGTNVKGALPTNTRYWRMVTASTNATAYSSTATYNKGSERVDIKKRVYKLSSIDELDAVPIYDARTESIAPPMNTSVLTTLPYGKAYEFGTWSESQKHRNLVYWNGGEEWRLYPNDGIDDSCALRMQVVRNSDSAYVRLRGDETHGGSIFLYSKDDPSLAGGLREYVGTSVFVNNKTVKATGETTFYSDSGSPITIDTNGNADALTLSRYNSVNFSIYQNSINSWVTTRNGCALQFSTSENGELDESNGFFFKDYALRPMSAAVSLGSAIEKWSTIYAATGSINTSDERLKTQMVSVNAAEKRAAMKIKAIIKRYKFTDMVEQKGDSARYHFGVGAQTVGQIMRDEGLNPNEYAFYCFDEWGAKDAIVDDNGNIESKAVEAGSRYGIRYDELAMFILYAI